MPKKISDEEYCELVLIDLIMQLQGGIAIADVKPRFSKKDYEDAFNEDSKKKKRGANPALDHDHSQT